MPSDTIAYPSFDKRYPVRMQYAPEPTEEQLSALANALSPGSTVMFDHRILGGLGCTMDVLRVEERSGSEFKAILRRRGNWSRDDNMAAARAELEVLCLLRSNGIPVPEPLWADETGIFTEPATLIEFIEGKPLMAPEDPIDYTTQLALMLVRLHDISPNPAVRSTLRDYNAQETEAFAHVDPPKYVAGHHLGAKLWATQRSELKRTSLEAGVFLHGDYWPGNTLWQGQKLVAIVDFEEVGTGDPALDVGTAIVNYRFEPWRDAADNFIAVYKAESGRDLDTLRFWSLRELRRPMPDIARWFPSFKEFSSRPDLTVDQLRSLHEGLVKEELS